MYPYSAFLAISDFLVLLFLFFLCRVAGGNSRVLVHHTMEAPWLVSLLPLDQSSALAVVAMTT